MRKHVKCKKCNTEYDLDVNNKCPTCKRRDTSFKKLSNVKTINTPLHSELSQKKKDTDED